MIDILLLVFVGVIAVGETINTVLNVKDRYDFKKSWSYRHFPDNKSDKDDVLPFVLAP